MKGTLQLVKGVTIALLLIFSYTIASSQTMMPLPNHSRVYSGSARGYWFVAPVDFTITGLRVASQAGSGSQYIHVMKLNTTPPVAFTAQSTNFNTLTYISNAANGVIQSVNIQVFAGDVIGILGTAGTSNSYSASFFNTTIAGQAVTLSRFGYQGNITGGAAPRYWGVGPGGGGNISRVEMYYSTGPPCTGITGLAINNLNSIGASFSWTAPTDTKGYEYKVTTTTGQATTGVTATTSTNGSVIGLTPATSYYLQVRNQCQSNSWSKWDTLAFTTLDECTTPSGFTTTYIDSNSANVTWTGSTTAINFQYLLNLSRNTPTNTTGAVTTTNNFASFTGLTSGTTYYIHIRSFCTGSDSSGWSLDSFYVPIPCRPPHLKITNIGTSQGVASWAKVLTAVRYEYAVDKNATPPPTGTPIYSNSYYFPFLNDGNKYYIHVRTICEDRKVKSDSRWATTAFETTPLGIKVLGQDDNLLNVYPNPAANILHVDIDAAIGNDAVVQIVDVRGRVITTEEVTTTKLSIDVSRIPSGIYMLKYSDEHHAQVVKFTKE